MTFDIGGADSAGNRPISIGAGTIGGSMVTSADPAIDGEFTDENGDPLPPHTIADFLNCATREWIVRTADGNSHTVFFSACTSELGAPSGDTIGSTQTGTGSPSALVD